MVLDPVEKWAQVFAVLGSYERLSILIVLNSIEYIRHTHEETDPHTSGCLSFTQIAESAEIDSDTRLSYHLSKLIDAELIEKIPVKDKKGRVFPLYKTTIKWQKFASEFGIDERIKDYIRGKYPETFIDRE